MHSFRHAGYDAAWDQLVAWRSPLRSPTKRKEANRLMHYVAERKPMIRYPEFRRRGWQIGSGPTESECKTTTQRVKRPRSPLDSANAEAMIALACLDDSRMWQTYWTTLNPARFNAARKYGRTPARCALDNVHPYIVLLSRGTYDICQTTHRKGGYIWDCSTR